MTGSLTKCVLVGLMLSTFSLKVTATSCDTLKQNLNEQRQLEQEANKEHAHYSKQFARYRVKEEKSKNDFNEHQSRKDKLNMLYYGQLLAKIQSVLDSLQARRMQAQKGKNHFEILYNKKCTNSG